MVADVSFRRLWKPGLWERMTARGWRGDDRLMNLQRTSTEGTGRADAPPGGEGGLEVGFQHHAIAGFTLAHVF
ncbi:hypothetical protein B1209_24110 [Raoultella planticola]|nr:hypothetical protein B1209_24110 [Raoultella planticola]